MKLSRKQRYFIRQNSSRRSDEDIADNLGLSSEVVRKARMSMGLNPMREESRQGYLPDTSGPREGFYAQRNQRNAWRPIVFLILGVVVCSVYGNTLFNTFVYDDKDVIVKKNFIKYFTKNLPYLFKKDCLIRSGELSYRPVVTFSYMLDYAVWTQLPFLRLYEIKSFLERTDVPERDKIFAFLRSHAKELDGPEREGVVEKTKTLFGSIPTRDFESVVLYRPIGFHVTNLILHLIAVVVFYLLIESFWGKSMRSLLGALLFAIHTVNTETVNCISYREDILTMLFCIAALFCYRKYAEKESGRGGYYLSLIFYFFGVFSKEMSLSFPLLVIAYDFFFASSFRLRDLWTRAIRVYFGYFAITFFYLFVRFYLFRDIHETEIPYPGESMFINMLTMSGVFLKYIKLMLWPVSLTCHYLIMPQMRIFAPEVIVSFIIHGGMVLAAWVLRKKQPVLAFVLTGYLISLLPVANILPVVNILAERYLYYPLAFFVMGTVIIIEQALLKIVSIANLRKCYDISIVSILGLAIIVFAYMGFLRNSDWFDNYTLWKSAVGVSPESAKAHNNLGLAYKDKGLSDKAVFEYEEAMRVNPEYTDAGNNLAILYGELNRHDLEIETYMKCLRINPNDATMNYNAGMANMEQNHLEEAVKLVKRAVEIEPDYVNAHNGLAIIYSRLGKLELAKRHWEIALSIDPDHTSSKKNLSELLKHMDKNSKP